MKNPQLINAGEFNLPLNEAKRHALLDRSSNLTAEQLSKVSGGEADGICGMTEGIPGRCIDLPMDGVFGEVNVGDGEGSEGPDGGECGDGGE